MSDTFMDDALSAAGHAFGGAVGEADEQSIYGIRLPYFCLRYLFASDVLPCGSSYLLAGPTGSCKTALLLEFCRLILADGGGAFVQHTEDKWPDTLPWSLMGELCRRLRVTTDVRVAQEWMKVFKSLLRDQLRKEPLCRMPIVLGLDSIAGAQGGDESKFITKEGAPRRNFSEVARLLKEYMPDFGKWLRETSALAIFVQHMKFDSDGNPLIPGGSSKDFHSSYILHLSGSRKKVEPDKTGQISFWLKIAKDSYGPGGAAIDPTMSWSYDEEGRQLTRFNWPELSVNIIERWLGSGYSAIPQKSHPIRQFFGDLSAKSGGSAGTVFCLPEVTGGETFLSRREFGEAIEANETFRKSLDALVHITQRETASEYFARLDREAGEAEQAKKRGRRKKKKEAADAGPGSAASSV